MRLNTLRLFLALLYTTTALFSFAQNNETLNPENFSHGQTYTEEHIQELLDSSLICIKNQEFNKALLLCTEVINIESHMELSDRYRIRLNDHLSLALSGVNAYDFAISHTTKAMDLILAKPTIEPYEVLWRLGRIGTYFTLNKQLDSALVYFKKALPWSFKLGDSLYISSAYNNLGIAFSKLDSRDSAFYYFQTAKQVLSLNSHASWGLLASINDNVAELMVKEQDFEQAKTLYQENYRILLGRKNLQRTFHAGIELARMQLKTNDLENTLSLLNKLDTLLDDDDNEQKKLWFQLLSDYYHQIGDIGKELLFVNEALNRLELIHEESRQRQNAINSRLSGYAISGIERELELERLNLNAQKKELELSQQKAINRLLWIWASVLMALTIIIILYLNYRRKIHLREKEQQKLDAELALKKRDLEDFALEIHQKQEWTDKLSKKLNDIRGLNEKEQAWAIQSLLNDVKGTQVAEKRKKIFQANVEEVNHQFFEKLNTEFKGLTKSERELAGLLRMELSNKEIAELRNMEVTSVKRARSRLRKKLNLNPNTDIYSFLKSI